ncbi:hypothetical protein OIE63_29570 [Streptomyces sp. NBC_01795]|uniref:hypothetical protein n=1 Tax=Streptomyces sp. NBC_01795 TaxID=2975943 RepID=UPI002DDA4909|nr:hypothetical protein [Streptomyces sp. NBC_01795]WSA95245.1 hypothetical protein OIE63_29570 [Streptomyces sp. NBC_01795]
MSTDQSPEPEDRPGPRSRRRQPVILSVAAAVLLAGGGGAYWASTAASDSGDDASAGGPPKLSLDGEAASASESRGIAAGEPMGPRAYRAEGELPKGPDKAAVRHTGHRVGKSEMAELAKALKIKGSPKVTDGRWQVGGEKQGKGPKLAAERGASGGAWTYMGAGTVPLDTEVDSAPSPSGKPVPEDKAKDAVRPILKALDLKDASLKAGPAVGGTRTVTVSPKVDGLPTQGWDSTFVVGANGKITRGQGNWNETRKGTAYPVLSADATLDEMNKVSQSSGGHGPRPSCAKQSGKDATDCAPAKGGKAPKRESPKGKDRNEPSKVSGAAFGLSLERSHGKPVLVPAWIFDVKRPGGGGDLKVTHPAVEPKFLKSTPSGEDPAAPGSGAEQSAPPQVERPASPPSGPSTGEGDMGTGGGKAGTQAAESYKADGRTLTVRFWGGVCDDYKATADESGSSVKVTVKPEKKKGDKKVCVKIAKRQSVEVQLDKALGDRKVVDGRDGRKLPRK